MTRGRLNLERAAPARPRSRFTHRGQEQAPPAAHVSPALAAQPPASSGSLGVEMIATLQQTRGNAFVSRLMVQRDPIPATTAHQPARDTATYVELVRALEAQFTDRTPRQVLAMLRQVYYGMPWSADPTPQWREVLPGSPEPGDPRGRAGSGPGSLYDALRRSQDSIPGLDIAHVFAGLEALLNPTPSVEIEVPGPNVVVGMPNTEFATWGGDLGSAAGQALADPDIGERQRSDREYFQDKASPDDLEGNIDAFGILRGAGGRRGLAGALSGGGAAPAQGAPVSQILSQYYGAGPSRLASAHTTRYRDFVSALGGRMEGNRIANREELVLAIAPRVGSFARIWYWKEYKRVHGTARTAAAYALRDPTITILATLKSQIMTRFFLQWLEGRMAAGD